MNDWFDVLNVSIPVTDSRERMKAYGLALETQSNILNNMNKVMSTIRVKGKKSLLPFQKGKC